jgi:hypothetical protein
MQRYGIVGFGELLTSERYRQSGRATARSVPMTGAIPVVALTALVVLAFVARDRNYIMTGASLIMLAGALATYYGAVYWTSG